MDRTFPRALKEGLHLKFSVRLLNSNWQLRMLPRMKTMSESKVMLQVLEVRFQVVAVAACIPFDGSFQVRKRWVRRSWP